MMHAAEPDHREAVKDYFDDAFYLSANPDVRAAGIDPLDHFLLCGWKEGRNPSRTFNVSYYLTFHSDVARSGMNPLLHYAWAGRHEKRAFRRPLDAMRGYLEVSSAPSSRAKHWGGASDTSDAMPGYNLRKAWETIQFSDGLVLSASHDDYKINFGGVQRLVDAEEIAFCKAGWTYLHFCPAAPLPILAEPQDGRAFRIKLRLNGTLLGVTTLGELAESLIDIVSELDHAEFVIHHLLGHCLEGLAFLAKRLSIRPIVWVHDFFSICPNYALMRNDVAFCGAPGVESQGCKLCTSGADRASQAPRVAAFFETTRPVILAPSEPALDFWLNRSGLAYQTASVLPLARVVLSNDTDGFDTMALHASQPLRVAHIGHRALFKGWAVFEELALGLAGDSRYKFYQMGNNDGPALPGCIEHIPVRVLSSNQEAMIEAVAEQGIDVVMCWSIWPETFCYVAHEALAGGAFVITNAQAGNIWPAIRANAPDQGCRLENEAALRDVFADGAIRKLVSCAQRRRGALVSGRGTADWLVPGLDRRMAAEHPLMSASSQYEVL